MRPGHAPRTERRRATKAGHDAFLKRFLDQVPTDLPEADRLKMAESARKAYFGQLAGVQIQPGTAGPRSRAPQDVEVTAPGGSDGIDKVRDRRWAKFHVRREYGLTPTEMDVLDDLVHVVGSARPRWTGTYEELREENGRRPTGDCQSNRRSRRERAVHLGRPPLRQAPQWDRPDPRLRRAGRRYRVPAQEPRYC